MTNFRRKKEENRPSANVLPNWLCTQFVNRIDVVVRRRERFSSGGLVSTVHPLTGRYRLPRNSKAREDDARSKEDSIETRWDDFYGVPEKQFSGSTLRIDGESQMAQRLDFSVDGVTRLAGEDPARGRAVRKRFAETAPRRWVCHVIKFCKLSKRSWAAAALRKSLVLTARRQIVWKWQSLSATPRRTGRLSGLLRSINADGKRSGNISRLSPLPSPRWTLRECVSRTR